MVAAQYSAKFRRNQFVYICGDSRSFAVKKQWRPDSGLMLIAHPKPGAEEQKKGLPETGNPNYLVRAG